MIGYLYFPHTYTHTRKGSPFDYGTASDFTPAIPDSI
jgi:hypothetical protein